MVSLLLANCKKPIFRESFIALKTKTPMLTLGAFILLPFITMNSLNKVQLIGNLTANPEIKETPNGQKVASFSLATNRTWKDASGMKQEQVEFHNVTAWAGLATILEQYTSK